MFTLSPVSPAPMVPTSAAERWVVRLHRGENALMTLVLAAMVLLPVAEVVLRQFFRSGVPAGSPIVQHLVLAVAMFGGALAARGNRLVGLSAGNGWLKGRLKAPAQIASGGVAAAICALLCGASFQFALQSRGLGKIFAFGLRVWALQLLLAAGFGAVALRLVWHAAATMRGRALALLIAAVIATIPLFIPIDPAALRWPALGAIVVALAFGAPIFTALGGAALVLFWSAGEPVASVPLKIYHLTVNPTLPSIPLFTLAGYFLAEGKAAARLVRLFQALVGDLRGGPAIMVTLVCAFFTSFTGASGVTILALGGVLMPVLLTAGYGRRPALGLLTGAGSLGMLFPPCLPPILYSVVASSGGQTSVSIAEIFEGGLLPGLLLLGLTAWWGMHQAPPRAPGPRRSFDWREARGAFRGAIWELLVPVVALGSLFGGFATPVEAAALTALYAFIVNAVIHRDLDWKHATPRVMSECGLLIGGVLLILGVALAFTHYLVVAEVPDHAVAWAATLKSKWLVLLGLNVVLVVVGGFVEIYAAIVVVVPLLVPVGIQLGIDPIHLGIIFLATMELGFIAPPIGLNLLLASYRFDRPVAEVTRASLPMLAVLFIGVLLITYFPPLTTLLPRLLR